jgi:hypothetical protein
MAITRLTGGLTPADGSDPRTFPTIWNDAVDDIEQAESDIDALDTRIDNLTTDDVAEGTALYYTDQRAEDAADRQIAAATTDDLDEGSTNLYYTDTRVEAVIAGSTTDDLAEGTANLYFTDQRADDRADGRIAAATTDDLTEGATNLYYTDARADARIAAADTDDLAEGSTNLYYTDARVEAVIATSTTDDLDEGSTNLYYTDARASDAAPVQSVNGEIGTVVLNASDVGALAGTAIFEDLADVEFTSLSDGQTVAFDGTAGKWVNAAPGAITAGDIAALNLRWEDI